MASPEQTDELPELETAALEELGAEALAPVEPQTPVAAQADPFGDLGGLPAQTQDLAAQPEPQLDLAATPDLGASPELQAQAEPPPPAAAAEPPKPSTVSAKDLTDDILGGVDFDLPAPSAQPATAPKITPIQPKPMAPTPTASADGKPAAPAFAFKPATPAFASGGIPKPASPFGSGGSPSPSPSPLFGSKPAASPLAAVKPASPPPSPPPAGQVDPKSLFGDIGDLGGDDAPMAAASPAKPSADALREALLGDKPPAHVPPEALKLAFNLCRALVKKGVVSIDDLLT